MGKHIGELCFEIQAVLGFGTFSRVSTNTEASNVFQAVLSLHMPTRTPLFPRLNSP